MKRRAALLLAVTAACGSSTDAVMVEAAGPPAHRPYRDAPDVPERTVPVELPSQYEIPARRLLVRSPRADRASRGAVSVRGRVSAAPAPSGAAPLDDVWAALARCESGMRQDAVGEGKYLSYFQWALPTWRSVGGEGDPRDASYETQVELAKRLQARSGWGQWPRCSIKLGLR